MNQMSVSVAMCTYNGNRYVREQLESIAAQIRLPDEVIIVDDVSSDFTIQVIEEFCRQVSFPIRLLVNEENLGSTKNFEKAVINCSGDIIVFADQDDIWREDRLTKTCAFFEQNPAVNVVFSDADIIDGASKPVGRKIWEEVQFGEQTQAKWQADKAYEILFNGYVVTGATMAMRRSFLPLVLPFPTHIKYLIHDAWISLIAALHGSIDFISEPLIQYRQHESQQVGFKAPRKKVTIWDRFTRGRQEKLKHIEAEALRYRQLYDLLYSRKDIPKEKLQVLAQQRDHYQHRVTLPAERYRRVLPVWKEFKRGNYQRFHGYWMHTVLGDLLEN
ncbi:glycosyltransferase family 2 protein [Tellurirhabdus bombi]|uniref:glycosyltransferase family 2 protein n=1 Tax=Tellurirhabdus bombi TaxID=2907205 RepID=UPI001F279735|nr:glycosyltransferase family 2 protein [Tellurirhabdus bombi]